MSWYGGAVAVQSFCRDSPPCFDLHQRFNARVNWTEIGESQAADPMVTHKLPPVSTWDAFSHTRAHQQSIVGSPLVASLVRSAHYVSQEAQPGTVLPFLWLALWLTIRCAHAADVEGLWPNSVRHGCHQDVELLTGAAVQFAWRWQRNVVVPPQSQAQLQSQSLAISSGDAQFHRRGAWHGEAPLFWVERTASLSPSRADDIGSRLYQVRCTAQQLYLCGFLRSHMLHQC